MIKWYRKSTKCGYENARWLYLWFPELYDGVVRLGEGGHLLNSQHSQIRPVQSDQLNMAMLFWYLVKIGLFSLRYCTRVYTEQVTFYKVPEPHG